MTSNVVTGGLMGNLGRSLAARLGRKVQIHRVEYQVSRHTKSIKYTLVIEGCYPPALYGLTPNELKQRMAMLIDMLRCGVVMAPGVDETGFEEQPVVMGGFDVTDKEY